jgi:Mycothiol maleylpyruvate isomerase N-terminal domain
VVDRLDVPFLDAVGVTRRLLGRPEVAERWAEPSALERMSVGALACHLGSQPVRVAELLPTAAAGDAPVLASADEHYARAAWVTATSLDDPVNDRSVDDAEAELGPAVLLDRVDAAVDAVRQFLDTGTVAEVVAIPWQGWALRREEFLLTRLVEVVVHTDDLAASVGLPTPVFGEAAFDPVRDLLVRLAVRRHGQSAVVATLARAERSRPIAAF